MPELSNISSKLDIIYNTLNKQIEPTTNDVSENLTKQECKAL